VKAHAVWIVGVLFGLAWMLLTLGCVLFASAFAGPYKGGFSLREPKARPRNIGCVTIVGAIALGVIAGVIAFR
jgi:hypothetical protein